MSNNLLTVAYIGAIALFIISVWGLSKPETAPRGNIYGIIGMIIAVVATALSHEVTGYVPLIVAIIIGGNYWRDRRRQSSYDWIASNGRTV